MKEATETNGGKLRNKLCSAKFPSIIDTTLHVYELYRSNYVKSNVHTEVVLPTCKISNITVNFDITFLMFLFHENKVLFCVENLYIYSVGAVLIN